MIDAFGYSLWDMIDAYCVSTLTCLGYDLRDVDAFSVGEATCDWRSCGW